MSVAAPGGGPAGPRRPRILLVDDRRENLLALRAVLESLDVDLVEAASGEEALRCLLREEFALVVLDVQMPLMDGFETARLIKERGRTRYLPIIFLTAIANQPEHYLRGYSAGAVDYVAKPFEPDILRAKVAVFAELWLRGATIEAQRGELAQRVVELDQARAALARQTVELDRSNAALERFAQVTVAEIRQPLHTAAGFLDLLLERHGAALGEEAHLLADRARAVVERTQDRVGALLGEARAALDEVEREPVDLNAVLAEATRELQEPFGAAGGEIDVEGLPTVPGDRAALLRLFVSLLDNALRFRSSAPPRVAVRAEPQGESWRISVVDNGQGIDPAELPGLFTVFATPPSGGPGPGMPGVGPGSGVGLAVCRRVVERHGGTIWAEPTVSGGTTVVVELPAG